MLTDIIPAAWRARVYAAYAIVAAALTVAQTIYATTDTPQPTWLTVAVAVVVAVGAAIGVVARANVPTSDPAPVVVQPVTPTSVVHDEHGTITTYYSDGTQSTEPGV